MAAPQQQVQGTENKYRDCWEDRRSGLGSPSSRRTSRSSAWSGRTGRRRGSTSRWLDTWTGTWSEGPRTRCPCTRLSLNFGSSFWNSRQHWKQKGVGIIGTSTNSLSHLLYRTMSGSQSLSQGIWSFSMPPKSAGSHLSKSSSHSWSNHTFVVRTWFFSSWNQSV